MSEEHPNPNKIWFWRRVFAIAAMIALVVGIPSLVVFVSAEALEASTSIVNMWQFCMTLVIVAYVANCALEAYIERRAP